MECPLQKQHAPLLFAHNHSVLTKDPQTRPERWRNGSEIKREADWGTFNRSHRWSAVCNEQKQEAPLWRTNLTATTSQLTRQAIDLLLNEEVSALCIRGFYPKNLCRHLGKWILHHPDVQPYGQNAVDSMTGEMIYKNYHVNRVGSPRNLLIGKETGSPEYIEYFQKAREVTDAIRERTANRHPIDLLMWKLGHVMETAAERVLLDGKECCAGIGRITEPGADLILERLPHVDGVWPCAQHFGVNVYLYVPNRGGELETFGGPTLTADEVAQTSGERNFREDYFSSEKIKPGVGDLIIVNTRRPHAVLGFPYGPRVSVSSFMMYDPGQPLRFYS